MIKDLEILTREWADDVQSIPADNTTPTDVYVKIALDQHFADIGYYSRHDNYSSAFALYWSPRQQHAVDVYKMQFWADDHESFNTWALHRFSNGDVAIAPSKAVYDIGVALDNRPRTYIAYSDDNRKGLSETFDYLIDRGIALMLGNFKK